MLGWSFNDFKVQHWAANAIYYDTLQMFSINRRAAETECHVDTSAAIHMENYVPIQCSYACMGQMHSAKTQNYYLLEHTIVGGYSLNYD